MNKSFPQCFVQQLAMTAMVKCGQSEFLNIASLRGIEYIFIFLMIKYI